MATYKDDLDILTAASKDSNKLSLNAITELDNKGKLGMYGGGVAIPDEFGLMLYIHKDEIPFPEDWPFSNGKSLQEMEYITKNYEYVKTIGELDGNANVTYAHQKVSAEQTAFETGFLVTGFSVTKNNGWYFISSTNYFVFYPNGKAYFMSGGK